jgi:NitT/TauT family transport system substrate-binding protein
MERRGTDGRRWWRLGSRGGSGRPPGALLALLFALAACTSPGAPPGSAPAADGAGRPTLASPVATDGAPAAAPAAPPAPTAVRVALPTLDLSNLPLAVGLWAGHFREEGLEVELVRIGGQASLAALLNGEVQYLFGWGATSGGLVQGAPVKVLAILLDRPPHQVVVRPDIQRAADLRGRRIGVSRAGGSDEVLIERALQTAGLRLEDTEVVRIGETSPRYSALIANQVDAATLTEPFVHEAQRQGLYVLARGSDLLQLPVGIVSTTQQQLGEQPELVRRYLRAVARNLALLHDPAAFPAIVQQATPYFQLDPALAEIQVADALTWVTRDGEAPDDVLATALETARLQAGLPAPIPLAAAFDFTLLRQARREAGLP